MDHPRLTELMVSGKSIVAPGVYDMISARLAEQAGFEALYISGYGISASHLGLPDVGLMTFTDMVERVRVIAKSVRIPVIADADTGYGGLINLRHTVRAFEDAGVAAIQIEDQVFPKRCAHAKDVKVIEMQNMVRKIEVACDSRKNSEFLIVTRTDSLPEYGIDDAIRRAGAYADAGADIIFIENAKDLAQMQKICREVSAPLMVKMIPDNGMAASDSKTLEDLGYSVIIYPSLGFLAAGAAMKAGFKELREQGSVRAQLLENFDDFCTMLGFDEIYEFEDRWKDGQD